MSDGVGLSVGATNLAAVVVGRTAVTRSPVLTLYPHRPPEVGVPSENPNLNERGLIITDFVDRVGDPVGIVAADGSTHLADKVLADALRAMLYAVGAAGRPPNPSRSPIPHTGVPPPSTRFATRWPRCRSSNNRARRRWSPTPRRRSPHCRTTPACRLAA